MKFLTLLAVLVAFGAANGRAGQATNQSAAAGESASSRKAELEHARLLLARKDYLLAAAAFEQVLRYDPNDAQVLNQACVARLQLGELDRAEHLCKRAVRADKHLGSAVNNLGAIAYSNRRYGKAIRCYRKALSLGADKAAVWANLGYAYYAAQKYPEAMDAFGKALALNPRVLEENAAVGPLAEQHAAANLGMLDFLLAKSYAQAGDAQHTAEYLKLARDSGYKDLASAEKDPAFAKVIQDPRVQEVLHPPPASSPEQKTPGSN